MAGGFQALFRSSRFAALRHNQVVHATAPSTGRIGLKHSLPRDHKQHNWIPKNIDNNNGFPKLLSGAHNVHLLHVYSENFGDIPVSIGEMSSITSRGPVTNIDFAQISQKDLESLISAAEQKSTQYNLHTVDIARETFDFLDINRTSSDFFHPPSYRHHITEKKSEKKLPLSIPGNSAITVDTEPKPVDKFIRGRLFYFRQRSASSGALVYRAAIGGFIAHTAGKNTMALMQSKSREQPFKMVFFKVVSVKMNDLGWPEIQVEVVEDSKVDMAMPAATSILKESKDDLRSFARNVGKLTNFTSSEKKFDLTKSF
ncbi:hypothetical protein HK098_004812 [Nowakowskiella sp. JEL0407]|nr:hypothetical protein HK098_004812 [Nowakowskiella sp. JEL0407]